MAVAGIIDHIEHLPSGHNRIWRGIRSRTQKNFLTLPVTSSAAEQELRVLDDPRRKCPAVPHDRIAQEDLSRCDHPGCHERHLRLDPIHDDRARPGLPSREALLVL